MRMGGRVTRATRSLVVDDEGLGALLEPRIFPVVEHAAAGSTAEFGFRHGPFHAYRRRVDHRPAERHGQHHVVHSVEYDIAIPLWAPLYRPMVTRAALSPTPLRRTPWWAPPELFDAQASGLLAVACVLAMAIGWSQAAFGATLPLVRVDFDVTTGTVAGVWAAIRVAGLVGILLVALADRLDRARCAVALAVLAVATTIASGAAPSIGALASAQAVTGFLTTAGIGLLPILVVDALPVGARAYGAQVLLLAGGVGAAGPGVGFLLGDVDPAAWRLSYLGAVVLVVPLWIAARQLHTPSRSPASAPAAVAHEDEERQPWQLGAWMFVYAAFATPAWALLTDHLRNDQGLTSGEITVFFVITGIPAVAGFVLAGRLAARVDHRALVAVGFMGGGSALVAIYVVDGPAQWLAGAACFGLFALATPTATIFGPASFPAASRGRAIAVLNGLGIAGGALGLAVTSGLTSRDHSVATSLVVLGALAITVGLPVLRSLPLPARNS